MIPALVCIASWGQTVERIDEPRLMPTSAMAELIPDAFYLKRDGQWIHLAGGVQKTETRLEGVKGTMRRFFVRYAVRGFKMGNRKVAALSVLYYDDFVPSGQKGAILMFESLKVLVIVLEGKAPDFNIPWNQAKDVQLPSIGVIVPDPETLYDYVKTGETWAGIDRYVSKSVPAMYPTFMDKKPTEQIVWGVFPAKPKSGPEVRYLAPLEVGSEAIMKWDDMYWVVSPAKWEKFTKALKEML